jgi:hypothetical protein
MLESTLKNEDIMLEGEHIIQLFYLMAHRRQINHQSIHLINPHNIEVIMQFGTDNDTKKELDSQWCDKDIILIPICYHLHWSLIIHKTKENQWYHIDSMGQYHKRYAEAILKELTGGRRVTAYHRIASPNQRGSTECGFYTLFYMLIVITHPDSPEQWALDVSNVREENRLIFIQTLQQLLKEEK